jgi:hypothetical protein
VERAYELHGVPVLELPPEGRQLGTDRDAVDLVGKALSRDAKLLVIPAGRLIENFFSVKTRVAGEMLHRLLLYKLRVAIVGDVSRYIEESDSFRDFVVESNRANQVWFVASIEELEERLSRT